jgi:hypothetical protein
MSPLAVGHPLSAKVVAGTAAGKPTLDGVREKALG